MDETAHRTNQTAGHLVRRPGWPLHGRGALTLTLLLMLTWSLLQIDWSGDLLHPGGVAMIVQIVKGLATPDLSSATLSRTVESAWTTVVYAVTGMTLAILLAIPLGLLASGIFLQGRRFRSPSMIVGRTVLGFARAIHELVWAWLFVAAIGLSPFAAVFALAIPYAGILGRIYADLLNDLPAGPLRALRTAGASEAKVALYGRVPLVLPDVLSYSFYRFECALRSSAILSFVGLGGLGFQIQLALDDLKYGQVATYLYALVILVVLVDVWSSELRRRLVR